jgi:hypothetical protein
MTEATDPREQARAIVAELFAPENRDRLRRIDELCREQHGKGFLDCSWAEIEDLKSVLNARAAHAVHVADQAGAVAAEARACGCPVAVPRRPDGSHDLARAVVDHHCGLDQETP